MKMTRTYMYICTRMHARWFWSAVAAAARPRGRAVAVPSCAGAYVSGADGSNECPAGSVRIESEAACRTAAAAAGKTVGPYFVMTSSTSPRGCYYRTSGNDAWFNTHAVGAGDSGFQPLCAALATTGAPLTRRCADARGLRGARGHCV
jgi:hypothetical protein